MAAPFPVLPSRPLGRPLLLCPPLLLPPLLLPLLLLPLLLLLLSGCSSAPAGAETLRQIWQLRDQRQGGRAAHATLVRALGHRNPRVRRQAALALGAVTPGAVDTARSVEALARATRDQDPEVAAAAVFALGRLPGKDRWPRLGGLLAKGGPEFRIRILDSLRRQDRSAFRPVLHLLLDPVPAVRGHAALALLRLFGSRLRKPREARDPRQISLSLIALKASLSQTQDPEAHWRLVYALAHMVLEDAEEALIAFASSKEIGRWSRLFALRGLSVLPANAAIRQALLQVTGDPDWCLAYEAARALGRPSPYVGPGPAGTPPANYPDRSVALRLLQLRQHESPALRLEATRLLGNFRSQAELLLPLLNLPAPGPGEASGRASGRGSGGEALAAAGLVTRARLEGPLALGEIDRAMRHPDWRLRQGAARALAHLPGDLALDPLASLFRSDGDVRVRTAVLEALPAHRGSPAATALAIEALGTSELALRETLGSVLAKLGDRRAVPALIHAYGDSHGLSFAEPRKLFVRAVAELGRHEVEHEKQAILDFLARAAADPARVVRREARKQQRTLGSPVSPPSAEAKDGKESQESHEGSRSTPGPGEELHTPQLGEEIPWAFLEARPQLEVQTTRGRFRLLLFPDQAPIHCHNLIQLVETGDYQGRPFHRVVPNFVVQGGDHRGDGFGARAWHGGQIRDEINPIPFAAYTLGMPKTEDPDTGGDQIFITTAPTPHLDRRYTVFGKVIEGQSVLERIETGDRIQAITVLRK